MEITSAEFVISNSRADMCPKNQPARICFYRAVERREIKPHQYAYPTL